MRRVLVSIATLAAFSVGVAARGEHGRVDPDETWMPAGIDWAKATEVVVELQDNVFDPSDLVFRRGQPYKLVLRNVGKRAHDIVDDEFFHAIVLRRVTTQAGSVITPHVHSLYVQPGHETTLFFVPIHSINSVFICTLPGHREDGMEGAVSVEE